MYQNMAYKKRISIVANCSTLEFFFIYAMFDTSGEKKMDWERVRTKVTEHEKQTGKKVAYSPDCKDNTAISDYVWLPLRFVEPNEEHPNGMVYIDWRDQWSLDEYENE